jgi:hypothetical protein
MRAGPEPPIRALHDAPQRPRPTICAQFERPLGSGLEPPIRAPAEPIGSLNRRSEHRAMLGRAPACLHRARCAAPVLGVHRVLRAGWSSARLPTAPIGRLCHLRSILRSGAAKSNGTPDGWCPSIDALLTIGRDCVGYRWSMGSWESLRRRGLPGSQGPVKERVGVSFDEQRRSCRRSGRNCD